MRSIPYLLLFFFLAILCDPALSQEARYPIVENYGGIYEVENAVNPDPELTYKIIVDLKTMQPDKDKINPGLNNVARMINLHGLGGIDAEDLQVVVVVHGSATESILNNSGYQRKNQIDNPNLPLIDALRKADVSFYVCGQSLLARNYAQDEVYREVEVGLSMLTVVTTHLHKGYELLIFN